MPALDPLRGRGHRIDGKVDFERLAALAIVLLGGLHNLGIEARIELRMTLATDAVLVDLHHDGQPFNPLLSPAPQLTGDIADREIDGGLGIHLVRAMASDFSYAHDEEGNHLQLRFILPTSAEARP